MLMKLTSLIVLSLLLSIASTAQTGRLMKADDLYGKVAYAKAALVYENLLGSSVDTPELKAKLAHCYYQNHQLTKAEEVYRQAFSASTDLPLDHFFYFAQTLKQNGKYVESDQWMERFHGKEQKDNRGIQFTENTAYLTKILGSPTHFKIDTVFFNSPSADFGGYKYQAENQLLFVTSRRKSLIKRSWTWNADNFLDLYVVTPNDSKDNPTRYLKKVNTKFHEGPLSFNKAESQVYFTRNNLAKGKDRRDQKGIQNLKLYHASIDGFGKWTHVKELTINSRDFSVGHPVFSLDEKYLYYVSDMPGGFGGADIYCAQILPDGNLGTPVNLGSKVNTEGQEMFPWFSKDGQLFFSSDGQIGLGGLDIFVAEVDNEGNVTGVQHAGKDINSERDDFSLIFNRNSKNGYFSSNREGGQGSDDIYSFEMIEPFIFKLMLKGTLTDIASKERIPNAVVELKDAAGNVIATALTDGFGRYEFSVDPEKSFTLHFSAKGYESVKQSVSTVNPKGSEIIQNSDLEKLPTFGLYCLVVDASSKQPLSQTQLKITHKITGEVLMDTLTSAVGDVLRGLTKEKIGNQLNLTIDIKKDGYLGKTVNFTHNITQSGIINVHDKLDLSLDKLEVGMDLAKLIDIKPIYFDLNKFNIRKDAAIELEKIVKVMNEYPTMVIELGSHTDCRASIAYNEKLSDNRAKASAAYIKSRITNPERIYGKGYGESKLIVDCPCEGTVKSTCPEEEHQKNRRTEFVIMKM
jgi:outer membrane protein OmpA-like peptidoglycan-associated protein/tetratricopeptide (TPR) repeat protein